MNNPVQLVLVSLLICMPLAQTAQPSSCPGGYDVKSTILGSCYLIGNLKMNWFNAETFCMSTGGHLADITSLEELGFLREVLQRKGNDITTGVWFGGNDMVKQNTWMWAGSNQLVDNTLWDPGEPSTPSHRCALLYKPRDYRLHDHDCGLTVYQPMCKQMMVQ